MPRIRLFNLLSLAVLPLLAATLGASEPFQPIQPGEDPHDWECTYAVSETTCGKLIDAWGRDTLGDGMQVVNGTVTCGGCTPITTDDYYGNRVTVGYRCDDEVGYQVMLDDRQLRVPVYAEAGTNQGWQVTGWNLLRCLRTWDCYDFCAYDRETPACIVTVVINIGRFQPELDGPCKDEISPTDTDSDTDSGDGSGSDDDAVGSDADDGGDSTMDPPDPSMDPALDSGWY